MFPVEYFKSAYPLLSPFCTLQLSGCAALEAAKKKTTAKQTSHQSEIIIGGGQGRETRECCKQLVMVSRVGHFH